MPEPALQTYEWIETNNLSELVAHFARIHMLISLFDGDPEKWILFLQSSGTAAEREQDLPSAHRLRERLAVDPDHVERLSGLLREFSRLMA